MKTQKIENLTLIAQRIPPGDKWRLEPKFGDVEVYKGLTDALEAYFQITKQPCEFRLAPLDGKLYAITVNQVEIPEEKPKTFSIYGDY